MNRGNAVMQLDDFNVASRGRAGGLAGAFGRRENILIVIVRPCSC